QTISPSIRRFCQSPKAREKLYDRGRERRLRRRKMEGQVLAPPWTFLTCSLEEDTCTGRGGIFPFSTFVYTFRRDQSEILWLLYTGKNVVHQLTVSLEELYNGATRKLAVQKNVICEKCEGNNCLKCIYL
ncbi:hypothetical protein cypCar_00021262, partial [Cyprinus carpio]